MANSTLDVTQAFDHAQKLLKVVDNGDGTYSVATSVVSGAATLEVNLDSRREVEEPQEGPEETQKTSGTRRRMT